MADEEKAASGGMGAALLFEVGDGASDGGGHLVWYAGQVKWLGISDEDEGM